MFGRSITVRLTGLYHQQRRGKAFPSWKRFKARKVTLHRPVEPIFPAQVDTRQPVDALEERCEDRANPYQPERRQCLLCKHGVVPDYKNPRLLSQFLSSFSGRLYQKHVTGLCEHQQQAVKAALIQARSAGLMPLAIKDPRFANDPKLFNPMRPSRHNPF